MSEAYCICCGKPPAFPAEVKVPYICLACQTPAFPAAARATDPDTSQAAARSLDIQPMQREILIALHHNPGGLTGTQLAEATNLSLNTVTPRFAPLQRKGLIRDSGQRRPGPSGRRQIVWVLTEQRVLVFPAEAKVPAT